MDEAELKEFVQKEIEAQIKSYRRLAIAFLSGLGLLFVLAGAGLVSVDAIKKLIREDVLQVQDTVSDHLPDALKQAFQDDDLWNSLFRENVRQNISAALLKNVAVSYNDQFQLSTAEGIPSLRPVYFFASEAQKVVAFIDVRHTGSGEAEILEIKINRLPRVVFEDSEDVNFSILDLTPYLEESTNFLAATGDPNVHALTFRIRQSSQESDDTVFVKVLINVVGEVKAEQ